MEEDKIIEEAEDTTASEESQEENLEGQEQEEEAEDEGKKPGRIAVKVKKDKGPKKERVERRATKSEKKEDVPEEREGAKLFGLRTTANREDQVMDFISSNAAKKGLDVYSIVRPHGMRGYIFIEAGTRSDAEQAAFNVPYARGILPNIIDYKEIEHMIEQVKKEVNIKKNDIAEIISGPFKREKCKITRIDKTKDEVVVELLEAAVPIPITVKMDAVKVIRRDGEEEEDDMDD